MQACEIEFDDAGTITAVHESAGRAAYQTIVPGFVDVQVNGVDDVDVASARGDDWHRLGNLLLDQGVTAWCPTIVTAPLDRYGAALERVAAAQAEATRARLPTIIGAHLEGPFLGGAPGAHPPELLQPIDIDWLAALPDVVRLVTLAPELENSADAVKMLTGRGIVVSLGHSTSSLEAIEAAVSAGASMATHLYNGMSGVHHRQPGLAAAALIDDRLAVGLIADLVHVHPLMLTLAFRAKPADRVVLVTDAVAWRRGTIGHIAMELRDGTPRLPDGTLAGSAVTMDQSIRNLVEHCGVSLEHAVRAASRNPARAVGCVDRGDIAVGQRADFVALDDHVQVSGVWVAGAQVR